MFYLYVKDLRFGSTKSIKPVVLLCVFKLMHTFMHDVGKEIADHMSEENNCECDQSIS